MKETPLQASEKATPQHIYLQELKIDPLSLKDKYVLDIGSDKNDFVHWLKRADITNHAWGIDIDQEEASPDVFADSQALPFANNSFDVITAVHSVPTFLINHTNDQETFDIIKKSISEMLRITKENADIYINPIILSTSQEARQSAPAAYEKIQHELKDMPNITITITNKEMGALGATCTWHIQKRT